MACPDVLKPEQCDVLRQIAQYISDTGELIAKCKACGMDVDSHEARNREQAALVAALRREFFPQEP